MQLEYCFWRGNKIKLRAPESKDSETLFKWSSDSELDRNSYAIHLPVSYDTFKAHFDKICCLEPSDDSFRWMIEDDEGNLVGTINTFSCDRKSGTFRYGLGIGREYWGKGYAKEAIKIILRYYFGELQYQKATIEVYSFNERSLKLHESLGFMLEGKLRNMVYTNGCYYDTIVYGMTVQEFKSTDNLY